MSRETKVWTIFCRNWRQAAACENMRELDDTTRKLAGKYAHSNQHYKNKQGHTSMEPEAYMKI